MDMPFGWEKVSRDSEEYKGCVAAVTGVGGVAGLIVGAAGSPLTAGTSVAALGAAGVGMGFITGYLACPYLAPKVKKKLLDGAELSDLEAKNAAQAMGRYALVSDAKSATQLVSQIRAKVAGHKGTERPKFGEAARSAQSLLARKVKSV